VQSFRICKEHMPNQMESTACPACGVKNQRGSATCSSCGAEIEITDESVGFPDTDPALERVDPEERYELERYDTDTGAEAEIDCGLLRANGIACELGGQAIPGLPSNMILWVNKKDAAAARALLDETEMPEPDEAA
jgi:uncharacterized Zn finger protein (UPF0148 family)